MNIHMDIPAWWESLGPWWVNAGWPWMSEWMRSPGFAGFAAVVAAALAFAGNRHQARLNAWWQRVEWALNLYADPSSTTGQRMTGLAALAALQASKLAKKEEQDFVAGIVDATTLDPLGDGVEKDDLPPADTRSLEDEETGDPQESGSYSDQERRRETDDQERI